jgi:hypothetical protein
MERGFCLNAAIEQKRGEIGSRPLFSLKLQLFLCLRGRRDAPRYSAAKRQPFAIP